MIQCYAPTEPTAYEQKESFYEALHETVRQQKKGDILIVMGDLNTKTGSDNQDLEAIMGTHGLGNRNENGEMFTEFCLTNDLVIGGTIFPHKYIHKITWTSPDQKTCNQIGHITISKKWRSSLLDVRNKRGADMASDHYLLVGTLQIKLKSIKRQSSKIPSSKYNLEKLQNPFTLREFRSHLQDIEPNESENEPIRIWDQYKAKLHDTAKELLGTKRGTRDEWISDETWELINERKQIKNRLNSTNIQDEKRTLAGQLYETNRNVKRMARRDKRRWTDNLTQQAQEAVQKKNLREVHRITRKLANKPLSTNKPLKDEEGRIITSEDDQIRLWEEHFANILSRPLDDVIIEGTQSPILRIDTTSPNMNEIKAALKQLKDGKATGPDKISAELMKVDISRTAAILHPILQELWQKESIPHEWKEGIIIKLPKKGSFALRDVRITIPAAVERGKQARLRCNYDMEGDPLYAVKWYKGGREFFRYTPLDSPPFKQFPTPHLQVVESISNGTVVVLDNVSIESSGEFSCEISADAPSFFTIDATGTLQVVEVPKEGPVIKGLKSRYRLNDTLKAECTSTRSHPAANLTWFVNDYTVDPVHIRRSRAHPSPDGFYSARLGLRLLITRQLFVNGRLRIRCLASMHDIYTRSSEVSVEMEKPKIRIRTTPLPIFEWEAALSPEQRPQHTTLVFASSTNNKPDAGTSVHHKSSLVIFLISVVIACILR